MTQTKTKLLFILSTCLLLLSACCSPSSNKGFKPLFNGQNFDGWYLKIRNGDADLAKKVFTVENKMVHVFNDQWPDSIDYAGKNATHGLFYTNKTYSRYILKFEYKWGSKIANNFDRWQYDAGCYYHVTDDNIWPKGLEYQIRYNHIKNKNHTGDFWVSDPITWYSNADKTAFMLPKEGAFRVSNIKGEVIGKPTENFQALNNKWNHCEIIVMANQYAIHKLNGEVVNLATELGTTEGKIGFQSETAEIYYRNITIKEFTEDIPMSEFFKH